jgi:hypothetical protein
MGKLHGKFCIYIYIFCVNNNKDADVKCPQIMKCIFC